MASAADLVTDRYGITGYNDLRPSLESPERLGVDANRGDVRYAATGVSAFAFEDALYAVAKR